MPIIFAFLIGIFLFPVPSPAQADDTFLNYLFPSIFGEPDRGPKPQNTLIAPFAQNEQKNRILTEEEQQALVSPENNVPVTIPHRSAKYISDWASEHITGVFVFNPDKIKEALKKQKTDFSSVSPPEMGEFLTQHHLKLLEKSYTPAGRQSVASFLDQSKILFAMKRQQSVQAFAKNTPQIMNEGVFGGAYRWLIDVPITVSVLPVGMTSYVGKNKKMTPETQNLTIRIQVARTSFDSGFPDGMVIETFTVLGTSS